MTLRTVLLTASLFAAGFTAEYLGVKALNRMTEMSRIPPAGVRITKTYAFPCEEYTQEYLRGNCSEEYTKFSDGYQQVKVDVPERSYVFHDVNGDGKVDFVKAGGFRKIKRDTSNNNLFDEGDKRLYDLTHNVH
jgi:hypothetical protein